MTCVGNDFSFNEIFSRYVEAMGCKGDVLLAISTSGHSENILKAAVQAHNNGMKVIALTSKGENELSRLADIAVCAPQTERQIYGIRSNDRYDSTLRSVDMG